ncbi:AraC family transcriptional regulator [Streptomyces bathyalis]|uniref:AraC family transcriptional regulator n=1 Tax=Streptomyces bathyalis TaxID=2710756 RepID=A0A7T1T320_9ACTN|nr:helix-turn-helix domain-containing protein [Streptomyces bathyalis]QPP05463.1 AraC family transcriptional regulator [Streptomyces bathyalis]
MFETNDLDVGRSFMNATYGTELRMKGSERDQFIRHARYDVGCFCVDDVTLSMDIGYDVDPLGNLAIVQPRSGWVEHRWEGNSERVGPGDIAVISPPDRPFSATVHNLDFGSVVLSQPLLMRTAGFSEEEPDSSLQFSGTQPASADLGAQWREAVGYVRDVFSAGPDAMSEPLVVGNLARNLATNALRMFPNTGGPEPTSADGGDATAGAVARAVAFIEENAHKDISLADIAAAARVTPHALQIAFARHRTSSVFGCLRSVRLDRAHFELLAADDAASADGGETVASVGARWGFAKPADFVASYHHAYGVSPAETLAI